MIFRGFVVFGATVDEDKGNLVVLPGGGEGWVRRVVAGVEIPAPPPGHNLDRQGLRLYDWIAEALIRDGRNVKAAGIQIMMLAHSIKAWSEDMKLCVSIGRYGTSSNGNPYELAHSSNERNARTEIKKELPEACLTVMSMIEARLRESKTANPNQDDLFGDMVKFAAGRPSVQNG